MAEFEARRWVSVSSGLLLVCAIVLVSKLSHIEVHRTINLQDIEENSQIHDLQSKVAKLMAEVRKAGMDAEMDADKRDSLAMQLASDSGYGRTKPALNPLRQEEIEDELKEQISSEDHDVKTAETKRKALQRNLDKALNLLAKAQTKAFYQKQAELNAAAQKVKLSKILADKKAKQETLVSLPKKQAKKIEGGISSAKSHADTKEKIAALERRVQALTSALAALRRIKQTASQAGPAGEQYLAELGQRLLAMPAVRQVLAQSLDSKDLAIAQGIADSLGKNFTANPPVDPTIMAEYVIAAAEKEKGVLLQADAKTPAVNTSSILPPVDPALAAEAEQATKEVAIERKLKKKL